MNQVPDRIDTEMCWLCGKEAANSREHRVLRSRLDPLFHINDDRNPIMVFHPQADHAATSNGAKSNALKFGTTMCKKCNSETSQPWDISYKNFTDVGRKQPNYLRAVRELEWSVNFPCGIVEPRSLGKYYLKNICCRLIDNNQMIPASLLNYIRGGASAAPFRLHLVQDYLFLDELESYVGRWDFPTVKFIYSVRTGPDGSPTAVACSFHEGPYSVVFEYDADSTARSESNNFENEGKVPVLGRDELAADLQTLWAHLDRLISWIRASENKTTIENLRDEPDFVAKVWNLATR